MVVCTCGKHKKEDRDPGWPRLKTPIQKITKAKRADSMDQVVEHLPTQCKALKLRPQYCPKKTPKKQNK
jgi:hypothetical protein